MGNISFELPVVKFEQNNVGGIYVTARLLTVDPFVNRVRKRVNKPACAVRKRANKPACAVRKRVNKPACAVRKRANKPASAVRKWACTCTGRLVL